MVKRTLHLNLLPLTRSKTRQLDSLFGAYVNAANLSLQALKSSSARSKYILQSSVYPALKATGLHAQHIVDAVKEAWIARRHADRAVFKTLPIRFNSPRSGRFDYTKRGNPVFAVASLERGKRLALPVRQDGAYRRFKDLLGTGYTFTQFTLHHHHSSKKRFLFVSVALTKDFEAVEGKNVLGIDVGVARLAAVSVLSPQDRVLRQLYFGRELAQSRRDISVRRSRLQARADRGSSRARRALRKLRGYEGNLSQTMCYQTAHKIADLARQYEASIAIEDLKHLNGSKLSRKANRKVKRMPYAQFSIALKSVAWQEGIAVHMVSARNTSKTCPRCGYATRSNRKSQALFRCGNCGFTANADRAASINVAAKLLGERNGHVPNQIPLQTSPSGVAVNQPVRLYEGVDEPSHGLEQPPERKPPALAGGSLHGPLNDH